MATRLKNEALGIRRWALGKDKKEGEGLKKNSEARIKD
jgi:hypothetical protein